MFEKINYRDLTAKQKEIFNFQKVAAILADYGYNCIKLADDWQGADFLAYHNNGEDTLKVQLKGRVTINKKYFGKAIWMAFPLGNLWYLIEHDVLLSYVEETTNWLDTSSWLEGGAYSAKTPNKKLVARLRVHQL